MANEDSNIAVATRVPRSPPLRRPSPVPLKRERSHKLPVPPPLVGPSERPDLEKPDKALGVASLTVHAEANSPILTQRPTIKRTKSLPRTPNPYYHQCAAGNHPRDGSGSPLHNRSRRDPHRRCAVDIVCGLEAKRQRLREKAWHRYCQRAAKHPDRRLGAGQGVERMRELGLEMAGRGRNGHGPDRAQCVLSI